VTGTEVQQNQATVAEAPAIEQAKSSLPLSHGLLWAGAAVACFHLAYGTPWLAVLMVGYLFSLLQLMRARTGRQAFYLSLGAGMCIAAPHLFCFWIIFGPSAIALWLILAFWTALFVTVGRACLMRFGELRGSVLLPFLWIGLEYFRSELYYLRFSWLNVGYAFSASEYSPFLKSLGMYGIGFFAVTIAVGLWLMRSKRLIYFTLAATLLIFSLWWFVRPPYPRGRTVHVAGVQLEFPSEQEVIAALDKLIESKPDTEVIVLCEYAFMGVIPDSVKAWCKEHQRYLVAGGEDPAPRGNYYDTAFVLGTNGDIVFKQGKSVPVQFLKDGLPAKEQGLWESPWGKIGICICYDLSYTRVTDRLVRRGAQALIVPTMDLVTWGRHEHELHARVARVRAAEYGIPIFRVASSGVSQLVDKSGYERANAGFPGQKEMLSGTMFIGRSGSLPIDRWVGPVAACLSGLIILFLALPRRILPL
jgi:apolipoprotein N-acyltransferase